MATKADKHELSFDSGARDVLDALYQFEEKEKEGEKKCPPKKPRSRKQQAQTKEALKQARAEGGGFDQMSKNEVQAAAKKGGESPRKKKTC